MIKKELPDKLRKRISSQVEELAKLQKQMLMPRQMLAASLIKRYLGTSINKRTSEAFYLSWAKEGQTYLHHIPKSQVDQVRIQVQRWKVYRENLRQWQELTKSIGQDLKELGRMQNKRKLTKYGKKH